MKKKPRSCAAFTLVEMLVVIMIIAFLTAAVVTGLRAAQRQARAAQCQARLRNLHQACINYFSDTGGYPYAGSYEYRNPHNGNYVERRGWVVWIRKDGKAREDFDPWDDDPTKSHAKEYLHVGWGGQMAERSVREGAVYVYSSKDMSTYFCKNFKDNDSDVRRSYAMNNWFGSRRNELSRPRKLLDFSSEGYEPSRMGYIIELNDCDDLGDGFHGEEPVGTAASKKRKSLPADSVWDHDAPIIGDVEHYGLHHPKAGGLFGHVVFVDGHVESLAGGTDFDTKNKDLGTAKH